MTTTFWCIASKIFTQDSCSASLQTMVCLSHHCSRKTQKLITESPRSKSFIYMALRTASCPKQVVLSRGWDVHLGIATCSLVSYEESLYWLILVHVLMLNSLGKSEGKKRENNHKRKYVIITDALFEKK